MKKYWIIALLVLAGVGYWGYKELTRPLPGELFSELPREHITDISKVEYNSNPPTSGPHFAVWAKKGVYDQILSDGYLIHSLEHGYIVINYNCDSTSLKSQIPMTNDKYWGLDIGIWDFSVYAHGDDEIPESEPHPVEDSEEVKPLKQLRFTPPANTSWITPDNEPGVEVELPESFKTDGCKALVENLRPFTEKWERVVVVPRPNMEHAIALTAWRRLEWLDGFDKDKIEYFIKSYHNLGPEKTME